MNYFEKLPEGCIFEIISRTTPADAVRSTILSTGFKFVAKSDEIWGRFLPSDYQKIIDRSKLPLICNTKKELFFSLCDSPILLDSGRLSFFIDKHSGKKCFMIAARKLEILGSDDIHSWQWKKHHESRFSKVAYLHAVLQLDIRGKIGSKMLSPKTDYAAYLVFKLGRRSCELEYANSIIRFVKYESDTETEEQANTLKLVTSAKLRGDGWMEVELGHFNSKEGSDGPVEARLFEMKRSSIKSGLIVEGIEFRPKIIKCRASEVDLKF
ncbi:hypothetical protein KY290_009745 [Solanum tuberosum]|uniref:F-box family protein n=1 Tax=Solanum tuberosum TaxID=4113 RepID=A0ABQ7VVV4_SOLTU|nr:hypothetical protein KY289_010112 [Solanum tuberosum]KAH0708267.1 hypothetical protein KY284_009694 [Solanum tuberosum]KAH0772608.1 hypothetical protein KY290_009745 [Solanum tuberosum]